MTWIGRDRAPVAPVTTPGGPGSPGEPFPEPLGGEGASESVWGPLATRRGRWIAGGLALAVALLVGALVVQRALVSAPQTGINDSAVPLVTAIAPGLSPVTASVHFDGTIQARYDMPIGSEGETGRIAEIYVEAGDHVRRGQILARLDDSILRPQVERLTAALEEVRANAALAQAEYARAHGVEAAGALSAEDIEKRRSAAVTAAAEVKVAAAQLAEYQARLAHTELRAPTDGVVLTRTAEVGQIATPGGNALFHLARGGEVEMRGQVAEQDLPKLKIGQSALVRLTGLDRPFQGRVRLLGAVIDPQTRLGEIRVALDPDPLLRPGAFARAEVAVGQASRPVLPETAVLSDDRGTYVFVVGQDGRIERRGVTIADSSADGIVIASGLDGRERVVTTAAAFLRVGERVTVAPPKAP